ncbi:MAG: glucose-1-phosphate thymidylyltransferase [Candidatus Marinimicrobia bacterium]|nr:glucose-1-phosphate thymidylyltransferase [Candidatus Neomarinimicrobiota bacterium]
MKALITAGGKGTRLRPITHTQNKHLIPVANKRILDYAIEYVSEAGITEVGIITNKNDDEVKNVYGDGSKFGVKLTYIPQDSPRGLADCVRIAEPFIGKEPFVFYLGDNIIVGGIKKFVREFEENGTNCHLVLSKVPDPERFGVPEIEDDRIVRVEEKPSNPKSDFAVTGIYLYDHNIFEAVNNIEMSDRGELEISDAHQYLIDKGMEISYSEITGWWKDTGKPNDLIEANRLVLDSVERKIEGSVDDESIIQGRVNIAKGAKIENSHIRGPVVIGEGVKVIDSYIGPYTSLNRDTHVKNSEVEFSIVMQEVKIYNQNTRLENSILGKNAAIAKSVRKPGANKFIIGENSRVFLL